MTTPRNLAADVRAFYDALQPGPHVPMWVRARELAENLTRLGWAHRDAVAVPAVALPPSRGAVAARILALAQSRMPVIGFVFDGCGSSSLRIACEGSTVHLGSMAVQEIRALLQTRDDGGNPRKLEPVAARTVQGVGLSEGARETIRLALGSVE